MSAAISARDNPFPAGGAATFGAAIQAGADFEYMRTARDYLYRYLADYPQRLSDGSVVEVVPGGALPLSGGHGSGKTFLLNWLRAEASKVTWLPTRCVYAKSDSPSLTDLYKQLLRGLSREILLETVRLALQRIAQEITGSTRATEDTSRLLRKGGSLEAAYADRVLDANELYLVLRKRLDAVGTASAISTKIAAVIGVLGDAKIGKAAFSWLSGNEIAPEAKLPVEGPLWTRSDAADAADVAINALECIAALFRFAGTPLVILLDQMEDFVPPAEQLPDQGSSASVGTGDQPVTPPKAGEPTPSGKTQRASFTKKLIEQTVRQAALVYMAGTGIAWERFPRDVGHRFLRRTPLMVGNLNRLETEVLLNAYLGKDQGFPSSAIELVRTLSGGNAREILWIAHGAYAQTEGALERIGEDVLFAAVRASGSLADRSMLALQHIDAALHRARLVAREITLPNGHKIDRLVTGPRGRSLAVVLVVATDARAEVDAARQLAALRQQLAGTPSRPELLAVAIGYTSARVRTLVEAISKVLVFEESEFDAVCEAEIGAFVLAAEGAPAEGSPGPDSSATPEWFTKLDERLARIEASRVAEDREAVDRLASGASRLAEPQRAATEARTRWELLEGLEALHRALMASEPWMERATLRSLLVANETNVKNSAFDFLGGLYLDALDEVDVAARRFGANDPRLRPLSEVRLDIIRFMRGELMKQDPASPRGSLLWGIPPIVTAAGFAVLAFLGTWAILPPFLSTLSVPGYPYLLQLLLSLVAASFVTAMFFSYLKARGTPQRRYASLARHLESLRGLRESPLPRS